MALVIALDNASHDAGELRCHGRIAASHRRRRLGRLHVITERRDHLSAGRAWRRRHHRDPGERATPGTFHTPSEQQVDVLGSGFVIDQVDIVTNDHVVEDASDVTVGFVDGRTYPAKVLGSDPSTGRGGDSCRFAYVRAASA